MARATTETGIANISASLLKVDSVSSIDPPDAGSKFARIANLWYDESRRDTLADNTWNFAIKRLRVAADATDPDFGYGKRYLLPADYIRVATIGSEDIPETDYKVEDGFILCNLTSPIDLRYVYDQEDITKYSPKFIQAFARKLAANMAYDMTGSRTFANEMEQKYIEYLSSALGVDGQESPPTHKIVKSKWRAAKEGRGLVNQYYQGRVVT